MYHGPREEVIPFFSSLGFECPERKGVPDFLQEVTSKKDQGVSIIMFQKSLSLVLLHRDCMYTVESHGRRLMCHFALLYWILDQQYQIP